MRHRLSARTNSISVLVVCMLITLGSTMAVVAQGGLLSDEVHSTSLEGNLLVHRGEIAGIYYLWGEGSPHG